MSRTNESHPASVSLCMIVKNEAHIIRRALESARPFISYWVICDTGSTDGTPEVIREVLEGIPGELHITEWVNFGHNRSEAIRLSKGKSDYILFMDADMIANVSGEFRHKLTEDYYEIRYAGDIDYTQPMLVSNRHDWVYVGVTHEYIHAPTTKTWGFLPELALIHLGDGSNRSDKYERDVQLLEEGLKHEPDNIRYKFYLAQSYRHLDRWEPALEWYQKRIAEEGWHEERWYAVYQAAEMKNALGHPWSEVHAAYLAAIDMRPHRMEPVYAITKHYRETGEYMQGYMYSAMVMQGLAYPDQDMLFIEKPVYDYLLLLEHAICALACGRVSETIHAVNLMMKVHVLPEWVYLQAIEARSMALKMLYGDGRRDAAEVPDSSLRIKVIIPFHNPGAYLQACVQSLLTQDARNVEYIFIDDGSTDESAVFFPPKELPGCILRNDTRKGTAYNYHHAMKFFCQPDDIVVCLDGDDRLACDDALSHIRLQYAAHDCWVMYGQYTEDDGSRGISAPFASPNDFRTLRDYWRTSHIRTFRAGLYFSIADQDPEYSCMKDTDGNWLMMAVDAAMMFPLMELAGFDNVRFNERVLYVYSQSNPNSHHNTHRDSQREAFEAIRRRRPFHPVGSYLPMEVTTYDD